MKIKAIMEVARVLSQENVSEATLALPPAVFASLVADVEKIDNWTYSTRPPLQDLRVRCDGCTLTLVADSGMGMLWNEYLARRGLL